MDPVALSMVDAARDLGLTVESVRSFRRYFGPALAEQARQVLFRKVLANDAIEQVVDGPLSPRSPGAGHHVPFSARHRAAARPRRRRP